MTKLFDWLRTAELQLGIAPHTVLDPSYNGEAYRFYKISHAKAENKKMRLKFCIASTSQRGCHTYGRMHVWHSQPDL